MSTDTDANADGTRTVEVQVPAPLLDRIDAEWERRGYESRAAALRDALRGWVDPPTELSESTLSALETSREQADRGETVTAEEARERLGLDD